MASDLTVPPLRVRECNSAALANGDFVLYWMIAFRRTRWNFALQRAADYAQRLKKPLVILEALRCDYRWASDRLHRFVIDGMAVNERRLAPMAHRGAHYYPYVEPALGAGKGLLSALARRACVVVTDDFPSFFLPRMIAAAAEKLPVRLEAVDSNGLLPMRAADRVFITAHSFRTFLHKELANHLDDMPVADPLEHLTMPAKPGLITEVLKRWPAASVELLSGGGDLAGLPIDHTVAPVATPGGETEAQATMHEFLRRRLAMYVEHGNDPDHDARSGLSPYLHFGHISAHEVFSSVARHEDWSRDMLSPKGRGQREGWWNMSQPAEMFLDELITWRELGYNMASKREDYDQYESLPDWAKQTLARHARDRREFVYTLEELAAARTHDPIWNAAQTQLNREGRIHNYLRMLWGKKILEWSPSPQEALDTLIELNNRYAIDGRNPNSYSGIFWTLGRYDRPWGPERPIFGTIRYMSSASTMKKLELGEYLERYGGVEAVAAQDAQ